MVEITIVAMISFFGGIAKAPISILIMGTEMTGGFALFLPLMLATTVSYFVSGPKYSIYSAQVKDRSASPAHALEYEKPVMDEVLVEDAMQRNYPWVSPDDDLSVALNLLRTTKTKMVVVELARNLQGTISLENINPDSDLRSIKVEEVMNRNPLTISSKENIHVALDTLIKSTTGKLVVVSPSDGKTVLGTIGLSEIADAYNRQVRKIKNMQIRGNS